MDIVLKGVYLGAYKVRWINMIGDLSSINLCAISTTWYYLVAFSTARFSQILYLPNVDYVGKLRYLINKDRHNCPG